MTATETALRRLAAPLRGWSRAAWVATALGLAALALGGAAWLVRLGWVLSPLWVLGAWAAALAVLAIAAWYGRRHSSGLGAPGIAGRLETIGEWRHGSLTALLERSAPGTSESLLAAADRAQAEDVQRRGHAAVEPVRAEVRRRSAAGAACLVGGVALLLSAGPRDGAAAALWQPARAWRAAVAPVTLRPRRDVVERGGTAELEIEAVGRRVATLWIRTPGEGWRPRGVRLDSLGRAVAAVGPLTSNVHARVTSGRRASDTVLVKVRIPAFLGALGVTAHYPAYLGLEAEPVSTTGDTVLLPVGTRLETQGEATAALRRAAWTVSAASAASSSADSLRIAGARFSGSFVPRASGEYRLRLETTSGAPLGGDTVRVPIRLVPDSAPVVEVPLPGGDTTSAPGLRVPVVLDLRDDHGLTSAALVMRRVDRAGRPGPAQRLSVPLPPARTDRAILTAVLDLEALGLQPGDTLRWSALATDNSPRRQTGRSREFVLRIATGAELRAEQREATADIGRRLDSLAGATREATRATEDLARQRPNGANDRTDGKPSLDFADAKKAEAAAKAQQELTREAEDVQRKLDDLAKTAEAAGLADSAFQQRLAEVREQLARALSPELRERMAKLESALKNLDAEETREALQDLAAAQRQLREALERSRELFRRAAMEGDLASVKQEARDLAQEQRRWADQVPQQSDSARLAQAGKQEQQLAARADSMGAALQKLAQEAGQTSPESQQKLQQLAQTAKQAAQQMRQAGKSAQQGQRQQARQQGDQAAKQLEPLDDQVDQAGKDMAQQFRDEVMQALERTLAETSRLSERQLAIQSQLQRGAPTSQVRSDQAAVAEGVQRLLEQVRSTSGKNALVPPQIGQALAAAQQQMQRTLEGTQSATGSTREAAERAGEAVDALNAASYQMMRARGDVSGAASGSGLAEAMEKMSQLAQQQGGISQQAGGLIPMAGTQGGLQQMQMLAGRQRAVAAELERLRAQGQLAGAGELANEAKDLARRMEAGRLDRQTVERQERLFRRMLDAGRTLQGEERDEKKERQSTTATDGTERLPPALRERLLGDEGRPRVPTWEELQQLSPEERRLVVDYFRRLTAPAAPAAPR